MTTKEYAEIKTSGSATVCGNKGIADLLGITAEYARRNEELFRPALIDEKSLREKIYHAETLLRLWERRERGNIRTGYVRQRKTFRFRKRGCKGNYFRNEYYGKIQIHGKRFEHYASTYEDAAKWCRDMVNKYGKYY